MATGGRLTGELLNGQNAHIKKVKSIIWCSNDLFTKLEDLLTMLDVHHIGNLLKLLIP